MSKLMQIYDRGKKGKAGYKELSACLAMLCYGTTVKRSFLRNFRAKK